MLRIPFDGPALEGRMAVVHTTAGVTKGIVMAIARDGIDLAVDGAVRHLEQDEIRAIAPA